MPILSPVLLVLGLNELELKIVGGAIGAVLLGGQFVYNMILGRRSKTIEKSTRNTESETVSQTNLMERTLAHVLGVSQDVRTLDAKVDAHHVASQGDLQAVRLIAEQARDQSQQNTRRLDLIETRRGDRGLVTDTPAAGTPIPQPKEA